jgi:hypothetical protein
MVLAVNRMVKLITSFRSEPAARRSSSRQPGSHVVKNGIKRKLVLARPPRDQLPDLGAVPPDKDRGRLLPSMPWIGGEETGKVAVVSLRGLERVERLLFLVVLAKSLAELMQRIDALPRRDWRPLSGNLVHQLVNIFKLLQRWPTGIPCPPVRAWA